MKTIRNITYPVFALFAFAWFTLAPQARAVCQDACLPNNTVQGDDALISLTTGVGNTATGASALHFNTTGDNNTATGSAALQFNTIGTDNTAIGSSALNDNTRGVGNTAVGSVALLSNTSGSFNTANGSGALFANRIGVNNTASGSNALAGNSSGNDNTAIGFQALGFNLTGNNNAGNGFQALLSNTRGSRNTATGASALYNNTTGHNNVALGANAGFNLTTGNNNIDIGNVGVGGESQAIRIGTVGVQRKTFIAGISGMIVAGGVGVIVGTNGQLGTLVSSARFKEAINPMDKASEAILALKPVTFHYKHDLDPDGIPQFGLVAEEVEKVNPDLVAHDNQGKPYSVRYDAVNAMLLNEFLKEHRKVEEQAATIAQMKKEIERLTTGLQKVRAEIETSKPAPRVVSDN